MKAKIFPKTLKGEIKIPTSKSYAHRLIILSCFCTDTTIIEDLDFNDDIMATINCMQTLGAKIKIGKHHCEINGPLHDHIVNPVFHVNESGSTLRFLLPLIAHLCTNPTIIAKGNLLNRPLNIYADLIDFTIQNNQLIINQSFDQQDFTIDGNVSSQFISGLLFYLLYLNKKGSITINHDLVSKNYLLMSLEIAKKFNADVQWNENILNVYPSQLKTLKHYHNEIDFSQAAFFLVLNAINPNNHIVITNDQKHSLQGDIMIKDLIKNCANRDVIDLQNCPDLGPILICLYLAKGYQATFINTKRLKDKESNRILAMQQNLKFFNYALIEEPNSFTIKPLDQVIRDQPLIIDPCNDHRIVMSFAILATIQKQPITILQAEAINKSYPQFFNDLIALGGEVIYYE